MNSTGSDGLGLSLMIYLAALSGGLALVALPIYYMNSSTVIENTAVPSLGTPLSRPLYANHSGEPFPLALLKKQELPDPATVAALNSYAKASAPQPRRGASTAAHQANARAENASTELAAERRAPKRSGFPFFSLF